ncbi:MAG: gst [Caulobacter sp.]|nr:gst [Caulobacter sp.]
MKLYTADLSPFAARVRMAIAAKGVTGIEYALPPGGSLKSPEYLAINPMGKMPSLVLADGTVIPESETILEYLEDAFPETPLRPASAEGRAKVRLVSRVAELYVMEDLRVLFGQMNPKTRDQTVVDAALEKVDHGLTHLNIFLSGDEYAAGPVFTTADCSLAPVLFFVALMGSTFGKPDIIKNHPKVDAYWTGIQENPFARTVIEDMQRGLVALRTRA